ncbi:MAG: hypothetical protein ACRD4C_14545 [Candidatus Acidiferrales bacterium]
MASTTSDHVSSKGLMKQSGSHPPVSCTKVQTRYKALRTLRPSAKIKIDNSAPKRDESTS